MLLLTTSGCAARIASALKRPVRGNSLRRWRCQSEHADVRDEIAVVQVGVGNVFEQRADLTGAAVRRLTRIARLLELWNECRLVRAALLNRIRPLHLLPGRVCAIVVV